MGFVNKHLTVAYVWKLLNTSTWMLIKFRDVMYVIYKCHTSSLSLAKCSAKWLSIP